MLLDSFDFESQDEDIIANVTCLGFLVESPCLLHSPSKHIDVDLWELACLSTADNLVGLGRSGTLKVLGLSIVGRPLH